MKMVLSEAELTEYLCKQIYQFFPDGEEIKIPAKTLKESLNRLEFCFTNIRLYRKPQEQYPSFDYLHSDQYLTFLWILSNQIWLDTGDKKLSTKIYYLNKALHSFDCFFDNGLPSIFYIAHGIGITLGKAKFSDYLYVCKGVTVGTSRGGKYPVIEEHVSLGADSTIIGDLTLHSNSSVGAGVNLFNHDVSSWTAIIRDENGILRSIPQSTALSKYIFY
ncbi:hypothetical protein OAH94_01575 [Amylibacter sp.]|nr:hypothetical protein [Amylibacter sp.]